MEDEVREFLRTAGPLGFNEVLEKIGKLRKQGGQLSGSSATLSATLKKLQESGIVVRDVRSRTYSLTPVGLSVVTQSAKVQDAKPIRFDTRKLPRYVETAQRDLVSFLADAHVQALEMGGGKRIKLPSNMVEQVTNQLSHLTKGKSAAITALWSAIIMDFIRDFSGLLPAFILLQGTMNPIPFQSVQSVRREEVAKIIENATAIWDRSRIVRMQRVLSTYLSNPEVLTAMDKAIKDGKLNSNFAETEYEKLYRELTKQGYL